LRTRSQHVSNPIRPKLEGITPNRRIIGITVRFLEDARPEKHTGSFIL
jgi:hypothetical protein